MDELPSTYRMWIYSLDPTCADIRIQFDKLPEGVDVRGRLVGPLSRRKHRGSGLPLAPVDRAGKLSSGYT